MSQENLTLEHLSAYLPYGVEILQPDAEGRNTFTLDVEGLRIMEVQGFEYFKLKLRPLSDLTKEIEHNGVKFIPMQKTLRVIDDFYPIECYEQDCKWILKEVFEALKHFPYEKIQNLISWKFDVFGLIPKGLAVSVHDVG